MPRVTDNNSMNREKLIDKIRKLQAKAGSSEFDAETEAFASMAAKLIVEHEIDDSELADNPSVKTIGLEKFSRSDMRNAAFGYSSLFWKLAPLFRCAALARVSDDWNVAEAKMRRTSHIWLYGAEQDREALKQLIDFILVPQMMAAILRDKPRSRKSYARGWAVAVANRIETAQVNYCADIGALIPTNTEAQEMADSASSGSTKHAIDHSSLAAGSQAAQNADLGQTKVSAGQRLLGQ